MKKIRYLIIAIVLISCVLLVKNSIFLKKSAAKSSDILIIEKHYSDLTNCTITFIQQSTMLGSMKGSISIKDRADISVEWRDHQMFIGDFTNRIYADGVAGIWQRYQSDNTKYPSLVSVLNAAKGTSHGISYIIPMMLLGEKSLHDPELWTPVFIKGLSQNENALETKKGLVSFLIVYDAKIYKIIKTSRKLRITLGVVDEETTYVERKNN